MLARESLPAYFAIAAGVAMALRYSAEIVLGPPSGALAERFGPMRLLILLSCGSAVGLAAMGLGAVWSGVIAVVLLRGLIQPLPAPVAAGANPDRAACGRWRAPRPGAISGRLGRSPRARCSRWCPLLRCTE